MIPAATPVLQPRAFCPHDLRMIPLAAQNHSFSLGAQAWQSAAGHGHGAAYAVIITVWLEPKAGYCQRGTHSRAARHASRDRVQEALVGL